MDDKVYKPTEIQDAPFPNQDQASQDTSQQTGDVFTPKTMVDTPLPRKKIASEVIGATLNTSSRKILAEFEFTPSGAIQIGDYKEGQFGDIKISPAGIVARNVRGETTFALDGDTGDAVFKGTITAGSVISAGDIVGGTLVLSDTGTNMVVDSGTLELNAGTSIQLRGGNPSNYTRNPAYLDWLTSGSEYRVRFDLLEAYTGDVVTDYAFDISPSNAIGSTFSLGGANGFHDPSAWQYIYMTAGSGITMEVPYLEMVTSTKTKITGNLEVTGSVTKGSGSFDIPHPDPAKPKGTRLRHYFVESPTAGDNLYRFQVEVKNGIATIDLPDYFNHLNCNPQIWVSPVDVLGIARATVDTAQVTIHTTVDGFYNVLLIGTRKDDVATKDFDKYGIEYIKEE